MESEYNLNEWAAATELGQRLFIYNFGMIGDEFTSWTLVNSVTTEIESGVKQKVYIWKNTKVKTEQLVHVNIVERAYWQHAQAQLKDELNHCMRANIPKGNSRGIGDVRFIGDHPKKGLKTAVFFTRGNLQISVRSAGKTPIDVMKFARKLDDRLTKSPSKTEEKKGKAKKMDPVKISVKRQTKTVVVEKLHDLIVPGGWLRVVSDAGELRREGDTLNCTSLKGGKREIELLQYGDQ